MAMRFDTEISPKESAISGFTKFRWIQIGNLEI